MNRTQAIEQRLGVLRQRLAAASGGRPGRPGTVRVASDDADFDDTFPPKKKEDDDPIEAARPPVTALTDPEAEAQLQTGNVDELASPSTRGVADAADAQRVERHAVETMGTSAPPTSEILSGRNPGRFAHVVIDVLKRRVAGLEASNKNLTARLVAAARLERQRRAERVAAMMIEKGMFREKGPIARQRVAARSEAARLAGLPDAAFLEAERLVNGAPASSPVPQWTRHVPTAARPGAVARPVVAAASVGGGTDDSVLSEMFQ